MPLIKQLTEAALQAELDSPLKNTDNEPNRRNGITSKTMKSGSGGFELNTPRNRAGTFEPQLVKKNQPKLTPGMDRKILSMFGLGIGYRDIKHHLEETYGVEVSTGTISAVTD